MSQKQSKKMLRIGELAKASGVRASTIKFYSEIGILPFEQESTRLARRYDEVKVIRRLKEIKKLREKGSSVEEIVKR